MTRIGQNIALAWLCLAAAASLVCADSISLRPSARVRAGQPVTLADVAALQGDLARQLAGLTLRTGADAADDAKTEITLDEVRGALESAGVNWGRLALSGAACVLRFVEPAPPAAASLVGPVDAPRDSAESGALAIANAGTIRARVAVLVARVLGVELDELRVRFDSRDADLLDLGLAGRRVEAQPGAAAGSSERIPFTIWVYEVDRVAHRRTILVEAQVRVRVLVLTGQAARKAPIRASDVRAEQRWLAPGGSPLVGSLDALKIAVARSRLPAGTVLREAHLDLPTIVRKNELVAIHCVGPTIVLKAQARALADAAEGDVIAFKLEGAERTFRARVDGPGRAVLLLSQTPSEHTSAQGATP